MDQEVEVNEREPDAPGFEERGELVLLIERSATQQLRLSYGEFFGSPFMNLRVWWRDEDGWKPTKRGATIRKGELLPVVHALLDAAPLMGIEVAGEDVVEAEP